jgi:hypothetical protein
LSSKTVHAPALSSLDTLHGDVLTWRESYTRKCQTQAATFRPWSEPQSH